MLDCGPHRMTSKPGSDNLIKGQLAGAIRRKFPPDRK